MDTPRVLTVVYDEACDLCRRCRHWLEAQDTHVDIEFLAAGSPAARQRYADVPWLGTELVVVDESGNVWAGPAGFIMCLWATNEYRGWSHRLSSPTFAPLASWFFHVVSSNRSKIAAIVGGPKCDDGRCEHRAPAPWPSYQAPDGRCPACGAAVYGSASKCWACAAPLSMTREG